MVNPNKAMTEMKKYTYVQRQKTNKHLKTMNSKKKELLRISTGFLAYIVKWEMCRGSNYT